MKVPWQGPLIKEKLKQAVTPHEEGKLLWAVLDRYLIMSVDELCELIQQPRSWVMERLEIAR